MLRVVCVLKSGGDYTLDHVNQLRNTVHRNIAIQHSFICLSDLPQDQFGDGITVFRLRKDFRGFWAKSEVFLLAGSNLYLDLNIIVVRSLDSFVRAILNSDEGPRLWMLRGNKKEKWLSGVMAWRGDLGFIARDLKPIEIATYRFIHRYIRAKADERQIPIQPVQDFLTVDRISEEADLIIRKSK